MKQNYLIMVEASSIREELQWCQKGLRVLADLLASANPDDLGSMPDLGEGLSVLLEGHIGFENRCIEQLIERNRNLSELEEKLAEKRGGPT